ncbi:hypothetical protein PYW07_014276 [Mythimna separata]|uniref:Protein arginine N-methyltransferase 9-like n=1 Tax=Mythimna separata TaxID=271217 RepID=A0AAD7YZH0_MYTSE|nr:hypothetical protein PYW07_014276 [Mythimna separata]
MADIAYNYIMLARQLVLHNNLKKALCTYQRAFDLHPRIKNQFEKEFRAVLLRMNEELTAVGNNSGISTNFENAIRIFPGSAELLNDIGSYMCQSGYISEALCYFEKALNIDNSNVNIEKNLNNAKYFLFPRSQFRYLNDRIRNDAFRKAIRSRVTPAVDSVLDIDTGIGLLALYATECNPVTLIACHASTTMARLAKCVRQDNNAQKVVIKNKPSTALTYNDIYGTPSVLITDAIDAGIFGKQILQSVCHAWENLLQSNSKIIPGKAEFFVAGIHCEELNKTYKLCLDTKIILDVAHMNVHTTTHGGETYYSEDVNTYENVKYMSEPQSLLSIDFNNYHDVCEKLHKKKLYVAKLTAKEDGEINMVIGWFNLHLTDEIIITTDPRSETKANGWRQAGFFDILPKKLRKDDTANIPFVIRGGRLTTPPEANPTIARISPETLAFLNDVEYMDMIRKSVAAVCIYLGQIVNIYYADIVDLSPFPMFGVLTMKRGANSLICHVKNIQDQAFLTATLRANGIPEQKVTILVSDSWSHDVFRGKKFHVIFGNFIQINGEIDTSKKTVIDHLKQDHLIRGGLCLPESVTIMGQLIYSEWLEINNCVLDKNVDYRIAKLVNRYQASQVEFFDVACTEYQTLSEVIEISSCSDLNSEILNVTVAKDGECNAVLCWYKIQLMDGWYDIQTNRRNSFVKTMAFMVSPNAKVLYGDQAKLLKYVDPDGDFKLVLDIDSY